MPPAGLRLKNQPLSPRTHKEKCRHRLRPASGAPVFANGAATAAMAYAFNQLSQETANQRLDEGDSKAGYLYEDFESSDLGEARVAAANRWGAAGILTNREANWYVVELEGGGFGFTYPSVGAVDQTTVGLVDHEAVVSANARVSRVVEIGHNHLRGDLHFSGHDFAIYDNASLRRYDIWMWNQNGHAYRMSHQMYSGATMTTTFTTKDAEIQHSEAGRLT